MMDKINVINPQAQEGQSPGQETLQKDNSKQPTSTETSTNTNFGQQTTNYALQMTTTVDINNQSGDNGKTIISPAIGPSEMHSTPPVNSAPVIQPLLEADTPVIVAPLQVVDQSKNPVPNVDQKQDPSPQASPQKTVVTKVKLSDELNIFDWFRTTDIINQIAEKAKNSVDTVITALDPGMKEYLYSGGNINIMVVCDLNQFISPIRDAFQSVFGRATVVAAKHNPSSSDECSVKLASGFDASIVVANERIKRLRSDTSNVPQNQVVVAVQPCIVNLDNNDLKDGQSFSESQVPCVNKTNKWFFTYNVVIDDPVLSATLNSYSQLIPIEENVIAEARKSDSTQNFQESRLGFPKSIDEIMTGLMNLQSTEVQEPQESRWLKLWSGMSDLHLIRDLSTTVAHLYRRKRLRGIDD